MEREEDQTRELSIYIPQGRPCRIDPYTDDQKVRRSKWFGWGCLLVKGEGKKQKGNRSRRGAGLGKLDHHLRNTLAFVLMLRSKTHELSTL